MGNTLTLEHTINPYLHVKEPDSTPKTLEDSTFDPHLGFDYQRKQRVREYTEAEAEALRLHPSKRDFCGQFFISYMKCRGENYPYLWNCHHEKHALAHCQFQDQELRVREWERERRLRIRQKKIDQQQAMEVE